MKENIGYTTGVFDLFHIGHLNILKQAKENCDYLIVGVTTDEQVKKVKRKSPIIPFAERIKIVESIEFVDKAVPENDTNKFEAWKQLNFNSIFKGSDWKGTEKWNDYELKFKEVGVEVIYFPYTEGTSSTILTNTLEQLNNEENK